MARYATFYMLDFYLKLLLTKLTLDEFGVVFQLVERVADIELYYIDLIDIICRGVKFTLSPGSDSLLV